MVSRFVQGVDMYDDRLKALDARRAKLRAEYEASMKSLDQEYEQVVQEKKRAMVVQDPFREIVQAVRRFHMVYGTDGLGEVCPSRARIGGSVAVQSRSGDQVCATGVEQASAPAPVPRPEADSNSGGGRESEPNLPANLGEEAMDTASTPTSTSPDRPPRQEPSPASPKDLQQVQREGQVTPEGDSGQPQPTGVKSEAESIQDDCERVS